MRGRWVLAVIAAAAVEGVESISEIETTARTGIMTGMIGTGTGKASIGLAIVEIIVWSVAGRGRGMIPSIGEERMML